MEDQLRDLQEGVPDSFPEGQGKAELGFVKVEGPWGLELEAEALGSEEKGSPFYWLHTLF